MASTMMTRQFSAATSTSYRACPAPAVILRRRLAAPVRATVDVHTQERVEVDTGVKAVEVCEDHAAFQAMLAETGAANELLVVDFFTQWCGPCKLIAPKIEEMAAEHKGKGVRVAKVDCGKTPENKKWAMTAGIKVLPTFRYYKGGAEQHVEEVQGSNVGAIRAALERNKAA